MHCFYRVNLANLPALAVQSLPSERNGAIGHYRQQLCYLSLAEECASLTHNVCTTDRYTKMMRALAPRLHRCFVALLLLSFICGILIGITLITKSDVGNTGPNNLHDRQQEHRPKKDLILLERLQLRKPVAAVQSDLADAHQAEVDMNIDTYDMDDSKVEVDNADAENLILQTVKFRYTVPVPVDDSQFPLPNYNAHVFYYPWYGNPEFDGSYLHWNHAYLPHWDKEEDKHWPKGRHVPPDDIGANFYPELGPYSSRDPAVIDKHMQQIRSAGIGKSLPNC